MKDYIQRKVAEFKEIQKESFMTATAKPLLLQPEAVAWYEEDLIETITQALAEDRERVVRVFAEYIYDQMPYDEVGTKPSWVVGGNSLKQEDARALAIKLLSSLDNPLTDK